MTPEERMKSCSVCRKRELDTQRGLVCGRTHEKAAFEGACDDFDPDADAARRERGRQAVLRDRAPISGWLAFFLWVGGGFGAVFSLIRVLVDIASNEYSVFFAALYAEIALVLVAMAAYTIYAFYKRLPNAVALAKTYIAMIVIDGVFGMLILVVIDDYESVKTVFQQFVWALIWYSYLKYSSRVEAFYPSAGRTWGPVEKYALALYTVCCMSILAMSAAQSSTNVILSSDSYIRQSVEAAKAELPVDLGDDVEMFGIEYGDGVIRYSYRLMDAGKRGMDVEALSESVESTRQEILVGWAGMLVNDEFTAQCCRKKLTLVYAYYDRSGEFLYELVFTPEDYKDRMYEIGRMPDGGFPEGE